MILEAPPTHFTGKKLKREVLIESDSDSMEQLIAEGPRIDKNIPLMNKYYSDPHITNKKEIKDKIR